MAAMATLLPLYGVMCLVALVTAAVLLEKGGGDACLFKLVKLANKQFEFLRSSEQTVR